MNEVTKCCEHCEDGICNGICATCHGSGEGKLDGSTCSECHGIGDQIEYCDCPRGDERLAEEIF